MFEDNMRLVSFVVLSYNHKSFVKQAIESIVNQTYRAIEIVVIDDGSTDGSFELLIDLQREYGFKLIAQQNAGVVAALNRGVAETNGFYVIPHASDDVSELDRVERQIASFNGNEKIGFVVGGIRKISEYDQILEEWHPEKQRVYLFDDFVLGRAKATAVGCMYRGDVIRRVVPLDVSLPFEDVQLYWAVTSLGFECFNDGSICVVNYRIMPNSLGRSNKIKLHHAFLKFINRYKWHKFYQVALVRAKGGIFSQMSESDPVGAVKYWVKNIDELSIRDQVRGLIKIIIPRSILFRIKRKF